jgi:transaldolase
MFFSPELTSSVAAFVHAHAATDEYPPEPRTEPTDAFAALARSGTTLWIDTGDIAAARPLFGPSACLGVTTNNTLLAKEVASGRLDTLVGPAGALLAQFPDLTPAQLKLELAFILNATHGLRLTAAFPDADVSCELHTDLADDMEASVAYGQRLHDICPDHFVVKVPMTAAGLVAARQLGLRGVRVNLTLGMSPRQNYIACAYCTPAFANVFLGRVSSFIADSGLGTGEAVGEVGALLSARAVAAVSPHTRHIAASVRAGGQLATLAGCPVITAPPAAVKAFLDHPLPVPRSPLLDGAPVPSVSEALRIAHLAHVGIDSAHMDTWRLATLFAIDSVTADAARDLSEDPPSSVNSLVTRLRAAGLGDLFPELSEADREAITADGKIPDAKRWALRVAAGELAPDTLLRLAGLASFAADQAALDARVLMVLESSQ